MEARRTNIDSLSVDLMIEVLQRLPVKQLIGCKLVSKNWLSLISNPSFIKSHLLRSIEEKGDDETLIAHLFEDTEDEGDEILGEHGPFALIKLGAEEVAADLKFPYSRGEFSVQPEESVLVGSDCGIVCVSVCVITPHERYGSVFERKIYLWNPATKQSKLVPSHTHDSFSRCALGFGVNTSDLDCVIVSVASDWTPFSTLVYSSIYSAKSDSWREIIRVEPTDVPKKDHKFDLCLHGFILCIGYRGMMAFDLQNEVFVCGIELPVIGGGESTITSFSKDDLQAVIIDFNDSIAVTISNYDQPNDEYFNLWTLDDERCLRGDEVKASWTKMLSIDVGLSVSSVLGYYNSHDFMLVDEGGDWFLYKSDEEELRETPIYIDPCQVCKYVESLVPIPGSKQVRWIDGEENN